MRTRPVARAARDHRTVLGESATIGGRSGPEKIGDRVPPPGEFESSHPNVIGTGSRSYLPTMVREAPSPTPRR